MKRRVTSGRLLLVTGLLALGAASAPAGALAAGVVVTKALGAPYAIAPGGATLHVGRLLAVGHRRVTVAGRRVTLSGRVTPYVQGQQVILVAAVNGHVFKRVGVRMHTSGLTGKFDVTLVARRPGQVTVTVDHPESSVLSAFALKGSYKVLNPDVGVGAGGQFVQLLQQRLAALHLYIPQTGVYDLGTELAVDAYHRLLGEGEGHTTLDRMTLDDLLNGFGAFHVRYPNHGQHAEGDLADQVLAFIDGAQVHWLFPISSGKPSTPTILGDFQVYRKQPGYLPDGMYYSAFFTGGYAMHGYDPAPDYPASHGCMRLPIVDAIPAFDWIQMGDWVDTYYP
jgi:hypothetical protein